MVVLVVLVVAVAVAVVVVAVVVVVVIVVVVVVVAVVVLIVTTTSIPIHSYSIIRVDPVTEIIRSVVSFRYCYCNGSIHSQTVCTTTKPKSCAYRFFTLADLCLSRLVGRFMTFKGKAR